MSTASRIQSARRERLTAIFGALSDATRLEMFEMVVERGEVGCSEFDAHFPISKSTISYHTKMLNAAGLIETRRDGRFFFYRPRTDEINAQLDEIVAQFPALLSQFRNR